MLWGSAGAEEVLGFSEMVVDVAMCVALSKSLSGHGRRSRGPPPPEGGTADWTARTVGLGRGE